jgi:hypothetical protein
VNANHGRSDEVSPDQYRGRHCFGRPGSPGHWNARQERAGLFALRFQCVTSVSIRTGPVATYCDGVYKGKLPLLGAMMYDHLEWVDVLKGPQSTLNAQRTAGGGINVICRKPDFTTVGCVSVGYTNYDLLQIERAAQTPLTDNKKNCGVMTESFQNPRVW